MSRHCLIIAGEKSGEEHAMSFMPALMREHGDVHFFGVGGDQLRAQGVELLYSLSDFSGFGLSEVISKIPFYRKAMLHLVEEVKRRDCRTAILIDFQDFNLRLARKLKQLGVNVLYYVAPQAWVWRPWRAKALEESVHTLFTILPFEKQWFSDRGVQRVRSVIHPLVPRYAEQIRSLEKRHPDPRILRVALLPGSRNSEVRALLPVFIESIELLKKDQALEVHLVKTSSVDPLLYEGVREHVDVEHGSDELPDVLTISDVAIASSGTVTLATALFGVPTVVCYRVALFSAFFFKHFIRYFGRVSLANIIHGRSVFPELLQNQVTAARIVEPIQRWMKSPHEYEQLRETLLSTSSCLSGDDFSVSEYMGTVIEEAYART